MKSSEKFLDFKQIYEHTKERMTFPKWIFGEVNGRFTQVQTIMNKTGIESKDCLFIGDIIGGIESREAVEYMISKNVNVLTGDKEDTVLQLIDACDKENIDLIHMYSSIFEQNKGRDTLRSFAKGRQDLIKNLSKGKLSDVDSVIPAIKDQLLDPHESLDVLIGIFHPATIEWMRSLPIVFLFPNKDTLTTCRTIIVVMHGGLDTDISNNARFTTEQSAIWGHPCDSVTDGRDIIASMYPEQIKGEHIRKDEQMNYNYGQKTYGKDPVYSLQMKQQSNYMNGITILQVPIQQEENQPVVAGTYDIYKTGSLNYYGAGLMTKKKIKFNPVTGGTTIESND